MFDPLEDSEPAENKIFDPWDPASKARRWDPFSGFRPQGGPARRTDDLDDRDRDPLGSLADRITAHALKVRGAALQLALSRPHGVKAALEWKAMRIQLSLEAIHLRQLERELQDWLARQGLGR
ncbi:MAG: hypothetical protein ABSB61_04885 [Anaerolineales bacterium]|jgi:hypothetical protein